MPPIRFAFGVHLHQPIGNFDHVFERHVREAYLPFLSRVAERGFLPIALHVSGPLLEWLEVHDRRLLDLVGRLAADRQLELLLAGFYEPVLASLPRPDRLEQIGWMREALRRLFGVEASGLWLTERVWEPELAADLADAGVRFALVDDRHFLVTGFERDRLHAPFWTESGGKRVALFPIDERLRYLIPFQPPEETAAYLRALRAEGHRLAVLADDGEKFGGWPGTHEWVYDRGWLDRFCDTLGGLVAGGEVRLSTFAEALAEVPSAGLAYLPTASYREMEAWSLPPAAAVRLARLERDLGPQRVAGPDGALVRGAHWRNFLAKYAEANRMHKKMQALSALARERGDPPEARRAIGRAQCNDAYWHGVFGGLYLPHLRAAIWRELAAAEAVLRRDEPLACEALDLDGDGHPELWIHSGRFSAVLSPRRGAAIEEYTVFDAGTNYADTLTRRREAHHLLALGDGAAPESGGSAGTPSIHAIEQGIRLGELPPVDREDRSLVVERVLDQHESFDRYARGDYRPVVSWAGQPFTVETRGGAHRIELVLRSEDRALEKVIVFGGDGLLGIEYRWRPAALPADGYFAPEVSLARPLPLRPVPEVEAWAYPIETVAKSERGLDHTIQGRSLTPRWPVSAGSARLALDGN
ncbi:MAG TPA: alpha-amylase/4-alpha-glucanotransferase domain-containing protein [Gemmatimonadales bacterium]|nr:alpha-amylase/4-alpha-glucanotransferase domain-containing protein [Gemmatimonadales bacterium]